MNRIVDAESAGKPMTKIEVLATLEFLGRTHFRMSDVEKLVKVSEDYEKNYQCLRLSVGTGLHEHYLKRELELWRKGKQLRDRLGMTWVSPTAEEEPILTEYAMYKKIKEEVRW